jgi:hypothetical protein
MPLLYPLQTPKAIQNEPVFPGVKAETLTIAGFRLNGIDCFSEEARVVVAPIHSAPAGTGVIAADFVISCGHGRPFSRTAKNSLQYEGGRGANQIDLSKRGAAGCIAPGGVRMVARQRKAGLRLGLGLRLGAAT